MKNISSEQAARAEAAERDLDITHLGTGGDGIAQTETGAVYVPFTLPGERVRAKVTGARGELVALLAASDRRVPPICRHFDACGGCALQHASEDDYAAWKTDVVRRELARAGLAPPTGELVRFETASRRRAALTGVNRGGAIALGYRAARSETVIGLAECPVLLPALAGLLPGLKSMLKAALCPGQEARVALTAAANGIDVVAEGPRLASPQWNTARDQLALPGVIRAQWNGDVLLFREQPVVAFGSARVALPAGAFLQAVEAAEKALAERVCAWLAPAAKRGALCDLFAGLGAFTFPLAAMAPVSAYEGDGEAVSAMKAAARRATGLKPVTGTRRDLYRHPLSAPELNRFAGLVFDPPREGAEAQAQMIAASSVPLVAGVSCNPATFARDAALLAAGGYVLEEVVPFDQFRFTGHVELAGLFRREATRKKKGRRSSALRG